MQSLWDFWDLISILHVSLALMKRADQVSFLKEVFFCGFGTLCSRRASAQYCQTAHKRGTQSDSSVLGLLRISLRVWTRSIQLSAENSTVSDSARPPCDPQPRASHIAKHVHLMKPAKNTTGSRDPTESKLRCYRLYFAQR